MFGQPCDRGRQGICLYHIRTTCCGRVWILLASRFVTVVAPMHVQLRGGFDFSASRTMLTPVFISRVRITSYKEVIAPHRAPLGDVVLSLHWPGSQCRAGISMDSLQTLAAIAKIWNNGAHDFGALIYQRSGSSRTSTTISRHQTALPLYRHTRRWHDRTKTLPSIAEAAQM